MTRSDREWLLVFFFSIGWWLIVAVFVGILAGCSHGGGICPRAASSGGATSGPARCPDSR